MTDTLSLRDHSKLGFVLNAIGDALANPDAYWRVGSEYVRPPSVGDPQKW